MTNPTIGIYTSSGEVATSTNILTGSSISLTHPTTCKSVNTFAYPISGLYETDTSCDSASVIGQILDSPGDGIFYYSLWGITSIAVTLGITISLLQSFALVSEYMLPFHMTDMF